jgi:hypothetical protein
MVVLPLTPCHHPPATDQNQKGDVVAAFVSPAAPERPSPWMSDQRNEDGVREHKAAATTAGILSITGTVLRRDVGDPFCRRRGAVRCRGFLGKGSWVMLTTLMGWRVRGAGVGAVRHVRMVALAIGVLLLAAVAPSQATASGVGTRDGAASPQAVTGYSAFAWGANETGQLGNGTTTQRWTPGRVIGTGAVWTKVSARGAHTVALKTNGTLWAWGYNEYGQLGDGTTIDRLRPVRVLGTGWASVTAGLGFTVGVRKDGALWAWGNNHVGELGDGTTTNRSRPVRIGTGTNWASVSAGGDHTVAVKTDGTLWAWGWNVYGRLGDGTTATRATPVRIGTDTRWVTVEVGGGHTLALRR